MNRASAWSRAVELLQAATLDGRLRRVGLGLPARAEIEEAWGDVVPDDLADFLSVVNGAELVDIGSVSTFLGSSISSDTHLCALRQHRENHIGAWPTGHVPFATDGCGNYHIFAPSPSRSSHWIAFWDHESALEPGDFAYYQASSIWHFIVGILEIGPSGPKGLSVDQYPWFEFPDGHPWPFDQQTVAEHDPVLGRYEGPLAPWRV